MNSQSFPARFEQAKQAIHNFDLPKINNFDFVRALLSVPLSYLLVILALGISAISGGLLIWLIYYLEATLIHRVHVGIIFMIAVGILTAIFISARSIIASFISTRIIEISKKIDTNVQHAELMNGIS